MKFYLGIHVPAWMRRTNVPLFVSRNTLKKYRNMPRAEGPFAVDSGAFSEIKRHGRWVYSEDEYVEFVKQVLEQAGTPDFVSPMDYMCEPWMVALTGLTIQIHQDLTVENYLRLAERLGTLVIPVLQGYSLKDYENCMNLYAQSGVDLEAVPLVGVGSVCKRQSSQEIHQVMDFIATCGIRAHGFGVKTGGLRRYQHYLSSADSMAWSFGARFSRPMEGCPHERCNNCMRYALAWYEKLVSELDNETAEAA